MAPHRCACVNPLSGRSLPELWRGGPGDSGRGLAMQLSDDGGHQAVRQGEAAEAVAAQVIGLTRSRKRIDILNDSSRSALPGCALMQGWSTMT